MKNIKYLSFGLTLFLVFSCNSTLQTIIGVYSEPQNPYKIELFKDSTFRYYGLYSEYSSGKWFRRSNNCIVLNSEIKEILVPLKIKREYTESDTCKIDVKVKVIGQKENDYECIPLTSNKIITKEPVRGSYIFIPAQSNNDICFDIWRVPYLIKNTVHLNERNPIKTEKIILNSKQHEHITIDIYFNDSLFDYKIFNETKVSIKDKKLRFYDKYNRKKIKIERSVN